MKREVSFCILSLLVTVLLSPGSCEHENHHHHHNDDGHHGSLPITADLTTTEIVVMQNGTFMEDVKDTFRASLALLVGVPIFGILLLCCFCYCCCKCCAICCEDEDKGQQVIVMQQNNAPAPVAQQTPTHIVVQQPVYQTPVYQMQPPPQWSPPPQAQHYPTENAAYDNPNYGAPSAPPQYGHKY